MWMLALLRNPLARLSGSSLLKTTSTQSSLALARIVSGVFKRLSWRTASSCSFNTNSWPTGSTMLAFWFSAIGSVMAWMTNSFRRVPSGQRLHGPCSPGRGGAGPGVARRRQLPLDPRPERLSRDREALALPVRGPADELIGRHGGKNAAGPIGKLVERRQAIQRVVLALFRVVDAPDHPHAGDIVMSHMAMDEIVSGALLAASAPALVLQVVALRRADRLGIHAFSGARHERRPLVEPLVEAGGL